MVGLTGGIASGKSTVAEFLRAEGARVIDADQLAREVVLPGKPAWREIVAYFGPEVLLPDGQLDRRKLGKIVFEDAQAREALNRFTHPRILAEVRRQLAAAREPVVVVEMPLLFEVGFEREVDEVWVVAAPPEVQEARLLARDGLTPAEARLRLAAQLPLEEKLRRATCVIENTGDLAATRAQVRRLWEEVKRRAAKEEGF